MQQFSDRVAAITGAGSGIGRALALELAHRGCHLALSDVDAAALAHTAELAAAFPVAVTTRRVDVSQRRSLQAWAAQVMRQHRRVNLLFNNAGVALGARVESVSPADFQWIMNVNFWGVVHGSQVFLPHLKASGAGHIVNLSSIFGIVAMPEQGAYNASKFAVRGFTEALRMELELDGSPVSATCVHPGGIATNIARAARIDPALLAARGISADEARRVADRMLQRTQPDAAARRILAGVQRNARRVLIGADAWVLDTAVRLMGASYQRLAMRITAGRRR